MRGAREERKLQEEEHRAPPPARSRWVKAFRKISSPASSSREREDAGTNLVTTEPGPRLKKMHLN